MLTDLAYRQMMDMDGWERAKKPWAASGSVIATNGLLMVAFL